MKILPLVFALFVSCLLCSGGTAVSSYLKKDDQWFAGKEAEVIFGTILSYQAETGGWPKNTNTTKEPFDGKKKDLQATFDNGATTDELRFLARIFGATGNEVARNAFEKGLDYILEAQYPNGGWPQFSPPGTKYHRHITFNDGSMVRIMEFLREVASDSRYEFVPKVEREASMKAFDLGLECLLKCQIVVNGRRTVWCAQHDEIDFQPRPARVYELVSLSGSESVGIVRLLMSLENPSPEVREAIEGAVAWFDSARIKGIRIEKVKDARAPKGTNKVVVADTRAKDLWARFYDIKTNEPIFCDRDGVAKKALKDIGFERRNGYSWYGTWAENLLEQQYPKWRAKLAAGAQSPGK